MLCKCVTISSPHHIAFVCVSAVCLCLKVNEKEREQCLLCSCIHLLKCVHTTVLYLRYHHLKEKVNEQTRTTTTSSMTNFQYAFFFLFILFFSIQISLELYCVHHNFILIKCKFSNWLFNSLCHVYALISNRKMRLVHCIVINKRKREKKYCFLFWFNGNCLLHIIDIKC